MQIKRILKNDLTIFCGRSNSGKTMALVNLILAYKRNYKGKIWTFGIKQELTDKLKVKTFRSLLELEEIKGAIIIIDEVGLLFDLDNRKQKKQIDTTLRKVNHNGNKILLCGLPTDFKKYLCAKAKCFLFKTLNISDLINGSYVKELINQFKGEQKGTFILEIPINQMLCFDKHFWEEEIEYLKQYDTKKENTNLFEKGKCAK